MEATTLIAANILLLFIVAIGVYIERRVARLELTQSRWAAKARELRREVEELKRRVASEEDAGAVDNEAWSAKDAERRFTEGVANILGYGLCAAGKEAERGEDTGA